VAHEPAPEALSLTNRGPLDRALARVGLESAEPPRLFVRALVPAAVIWVPLLLLALVRPRDGAGAAISFFEDLATHVRFLLVVPLFVIAEATIGRRTRLVAAQFVSANLLKPADRPRFDALLRATHRALESNIAEAAIGLLAASLVWTAVRHLLGDGLIFWFETATPAGAARLTPAGWWYAVGSWLPVFLFLRWLWRYLVWCWLLFRISRLDLRLVATHPDRAAGLNFVSFGHTAFANLGFAASCLVAGAIGTRILHEGATLASFRFPIAAFIGLLIVFGLLPLTVFWRPLWRAKEAGLFEYGAFSSRYVQEFHRKWIGTKAGESPIEANDDIGPLCDIGESFDRTFGMRIMPITLKSALVFALAGLAPMLPLVLMVMPLQEVLKLLMRAMI
jgi:hypothetical protein